MRLAKQTVLGLCFIVSIQIPLLEAKLVDFPLDRMVKESEFIVIGEVVKLEKTNRTFRPLKTDNYELPLYSATVKVEKVIKGDTGVKELQIEYDLHPESAQFKLERAVIFVTQYEGKFVVVQGWEGLIPITRDIPFSSGTYSVGPINILNEARTQKLDQFVKRITANLEKSR